MRSMHGTRRPPGARRGSAHAATIGPTEQELSRFESEGGSTGPIRDRDRSPERGLQPRATDHRGRILLAYATTQKHTRVIADALAARLRSHGFTVEIGDASTGGMPPPQDYDVVVLGLPSTLGRHGRLIAAYIENNRAGLAEVPAAVFTVSKSGTFRNFNPGGFLAPLLRAVDWEPHLAAAFAGGAPFPRDGVLVRFAKWLGYEYKDASREGAALHTSWTDVQDFADTIATDLAGAAVTAARTTPHGLGH